MAETLKAKSLCKLKKEIISKHFDEIAAVTRDRKSTRLNSSHQIISYAVFCLKKKKNKKKKKKTK